MVNSNIMRQNAERKRVHQEKAGCIINGIVQHDWGDWGEWHYHRFETYLCRWEYKQRIRVCKRCKAREYEKLHI